MVNKLSTEQEKSLCEEYKNGAGPLELSLRYGVATNTIWRYLVKNNIPRNKHIVKRKQKSGNNVLGKIKKLLSNK